MIYEVKDIFAKTYPEPGKLYVYAQENSPEMDPDKRRPLILICPGGGYSMTSDREAEPIGMEYLAADCNVAILRYSTSPARYPTALLQVAGSVKYLRENAERYHIDTEKIVVLGFSAGGHLAASYGVFWKKETFLAESLGTNAEMLRPNGLILCYPVITSGPKAHRDSFLELLGERYEELVDKMSLEKQVDQDTPPAFLWHTAADPLVPVENSLLFFQALHDKGIPAELHIYPRGRHGLALANKKTLSYMNTGLQPECATWVPLSKTWLENLSCTDEPQTPMNT
ncbi:MAG TPA: alpha/beta hydrolase [Candidatus Limivivens intestinipullorum]|uniref:Alpha/beta hydrolase n=1 Tax=Candidatus Limivivens intestinipullorum TaxID=2840858 RepID=A0A9D1ESW6_9FIRM|nr:alpha/beta hydrolase [Candidatus Limivivens intestinipullorum]